MATKLLHFILTIFFVWHFQLGSHWTISHSKFLTLFSKFYFNFPSQYLYAIGLIVLFSVRSHLPPIVNFIHQSQDVLLSSQRRSLNTPKKNLRDYHSLWCSFPTDLNSPPKCQLPQPISYNSLPTYFSKDFNFALYPFHSPLLGVSLLISFPPVNDMLKFTGWFVMKRWKGFLEDILKQKLL
jgi:hypothetical protein